MASSLARVHRVVASAVLQPADSPSDRVLRVPGFVFLAVAVVAAATVVSRWW